MYFWKRISIIFFLADFCVASIPCAMYFLRAFFRNILQQETLKTVKCIFLRTITLNKARILRLFQQLSPFSSKCHNVYKLKNFQACSWNTFNHVEKKKVALCYPVFIKEMIKYFLGTLFSLWFSHFSLEVILDVL